MKPKKPKQKSVSQLKKIADKVFSIWVRRWSDSCYTCGRRLEPNQRQNGHFISRSHSATRYHEDNCRVQGSCCNIFRSGNIAEFGYRLRKEIGAKRFEELIKLGRTTHQFSRQELQQIIDKYKV